MKAILRKSLIVLLASAGLLLLLEGGARVALGQMDPPPAPITIDWEGAEDNHVRTRLRDQLYRPDRDLFYALRPGIQIEHSPTARIFDVRTNSLGLRGAEIESNKPAGTLRVLCLGDSCTFGSGAGTDETYPAQLARELARLHPDRHFEVINGGAPGYSSYQALRLLELVGFGLDLDLVIFTAGYNDCGAANPGVTRNFGDADQLTDLEYAERVALRKRSSFAIVRLIQRYRSYSKRAAPPLVEGPETVAKSRVSIDEYQDNIEALSRECSQHGIPALVMVWALESQSAAGAQPPAVRSGPDMSVAEIRAARDAQRILYQQRARDTAQAQGLGLVDLVPLVLGHSEWFIDNVHMNPSGYEAVARVLAEAAAPLLVR